MIQVNLTPEDVNAYVTQAIVQSTIGDVITKRINEAMTSYDIQRAIDSVIKDTALRMVSKEVENNPGINAKIEQAVRTALTDELVQAAVGKIVARLSRDW